MSVDSLLEAMLDPGEANDASDLQEMFSWMTDGYGLSSIAYLGLGISPDPREGPFVACTYSTEWINRYIAQRYVKIDPVVQIGMRRLLPIDWNNFGRADPEVSTLFGEASEFGLGRQGLTIPVHGPHGDRALLSVTSDLNDRDWHALRQSYTRDFQALAVHFHGIVLHQHGKQMTTASLSPRERECLLWIAEGKTAWECSVILGLSVSTVRCYLESARHKLGATSNTHAVAKAIKADIISTIP